MRIYLINSPPLKMRGDVGLLYPPLGIMYLAAYAREHTSGLEFKLADGYRLGYKESIRDMSNFKPDILGVSYTTQAATGAYKLINEIKKEEDNIFIISGGAHPTAMPEEVLTRSETDVVVLGEGEVTFNELINTIKKSEYNFDEILGIAYKQNGKIKINPERPLIEDLDSLPFPARDLLDIKEYPGYYIRKRKPEAVIISIRGCPYNCGFCSNPVWKLSRPWTRFRSPKSVADEIEHLISVYGIKEIFDECDEFNASLSWAKSVCDEIIRRNLDITWKVQVRANKVDDALAEKMARAGCWMVFLGIESGNEGTLAGIRKKITLEQVENALEIFKRHGIKTFGLFMAFNIWEEDGNLRFEDREKTENTLKFAERLIKEKKLDFMAWSLTTPYAGSELYDIVMRHNIVPKEMIGRWEEWDSSTNFFVNLPDVNEKDWIDMRNKGARIQAKTIIKSGNINLSAIQLHAKRGMQMIKRTLKKYAS